VTGELGELAVEPARDHAFGRMEHARVVHAIDLDPLAGAERG